MSVIATPAFTMPINYGYRLMQVLQAVFAAQAREVLARYSLEQIEAGKDIDLTHWVTATAGATRPLFLRLWQRGMLQSQQRIAALLWDRRLSHENLRRQELSVLGKEVMSNREMPEVWRADPLSGASQLYVTKASCRPSSMNAGGKGILCRDSCVLSGSWPLLYVSKAPARAPASSGFGYNWDLYSPRVLDAVDAAVMRFCRATNETATADLRTAKRDLRKLLKAGLKRGDAIRLLSNKVRKIFADPSRAFRIAATETSRAIHAGALYTAKKSGIVKKKEWLASSDACDRCLKLNGRQRLLDTPFYVDPSGGPYAVVLHPPLHPHCLLPETTVLAPELIVAMKTFFTGTCYRITFINGDKVSCTPNHMLLTSNGFLRASDFVEGDDVIRRSKRKWPSGGYPPDYRKPPSVEGVVSALAVSGSLPSASVMISPGYLHGDAAFCQGNINVIMADSLLRNVTDFGDSVQQHTNKPSFQCGDVPPFFEGKGELDLIIIRRSLHRLAALCSSGRRRESEAVLLALSRKSLPLVSRCYPGSSKGTDDSPGLATVQLSQRRSRTTFRVGINNLIDQGAFELLRVSRIESFFYRGWVYDLQTATTLYYINSGVVSSNCFCTLTEVLE